MQSKLNGITLAKSVDNILSRAFAKHPLSEENRREWERAIMLIRHTLDTMERVHKVTVPRQPTAQVGGQTATPPQSGILFAYHSPVWRQDALGNTYCELCNGTQHPGGTNEHP